jgi:hypothetical protein
MSACGAVYVVLGATEDADQLERCTRIDCPDHPVQLDWIRADEGRLAAYNEQLRRYAAGQQLRGQWQEVGLL